jgi:hypothetical protein
MKKRDWLILAVVLLVQFLIARLHLSVSRDADGPAPSPYCDENPAPGTLKRTVLTPGLYRHSV